jgi:hypothetical protein
VQETCRASGVSAFPRADRPHFPAWRTASLPGALCAGYREASASAGGNSSRSAVGRWWREGCDGGRALVVGA